MVDTALATTNGTDAPTRTLPDEVTITGAEASRIPSPGTQRTLKAQTGRTWDSLVGPDADSADRFQTLIWIHLRRQIPDLRWDECADVDVVIEEGAAGVDPTKLAGSATSPGSAGSGG